MWLESFFLQSPFSLQNIEYKNFNKHCQTSFSTIEVDNMKVWELVYLSSGSELIVLLQ